MGATKESAPGQKECHQAAERINSALRVLDQASLAAIGQNLEPRNENSLEGFQVRVECVEWVMGKTMSSSLRADIICAIDNSLNINIILYESISFISKKYL